MATCAGILDTNGLIYNSVWDDEFTTANDLTSEPWNTYDSRFGPVGATVATGAANNNCPSPAALWDELYFGIASANTLIANQNILPMKSLKIDALEKHIFFADIIITV
jgi:hypothetical protein